MLRALLYAFFGWSTPCAPRVYRARRPPNGRHTSSPAAGAGVGAGAARASAAASRPSAPSAYAVREAAEHGVHGQRAPRDADATVRPFERPDLVDLLGHGRRGSNDASARPCRPRPPRGPSFRCAWTSAPASPRARGAGGAARRRAARREVAAPHREAPEVPTAKDWPDDDSSSIARRSASWWRRAAPSASPSAPAEPQVRERRGARRRPLWPGGARGA